MTSSTKKQVLILSKGNSCRSQMAEALVNNRLSDSWEAYSAGTEPAGYVHPRAIDTLREIGIEHLGESKHVQDLPKKEFGLVLTVCNNAAKNCSAWLGEGKCVHISIPDPSGAIGTIEDILLTFSIIRDELESQILNYLKTTTIDEKRI